MADMSKCPSCGVKPSIMKIATKGNGYLHFQHLSNCQVGQAQRNPQCECAPKHRYHCSKCSAEFTLSSEFFVGGYTDGGGTHSLDCPVCWAVAEAKK